jgi:hypothetical protein
VEHLAPGPARKAVGCRTPMVLAGITFEEIVQLIVVFTIMNVIILAPVILALFRAFLEWRDNETIRQSRR